MCEFKKHIKRKNSFFLADLYLHLLLHFLKPCFDRLEIS